MQQRKRWIGSMTDKLEIKSVKLGIEPVNLKVNRQVLVDSLNINGFQWQIEKSLEEMVELQDILFKFKKNEAANEQVVGEIADAFLQIVILSEMFGLSNVQLFIERKLKAINKRNKVMGRRKAKVGF
jgi:NTP pyrophosphatase (non-canonical NTP hydrolase)